MSWLFSLFFHFWLLFWIHLVPISFNLNHHLMSWLFCLFFHFWLWFAIGRYLVPVFSVLNFLWCPDYSFCLTFILHFQILPFPGKILVSCFFCSEPSPNVLITLSIGHLFFHFPFQLCLRETLFICPDYSIYWMFITLLPNSAIPFEHFWFMSLHFWTILLCLDQSVYWTCILSLSDFALPWEDTWLLYLEPSPFVLNTLSIWDSFFHFLILHCLWETLYVNVFYLEPSMSW